MAAKTRNTRAALYVRISSDTEGTALGVKRQRDDCAALAEQLGWTIVETFEDNDVSATSGKPRPAYARMIDAIEAGRVNGIIVWDVDRLTRTPRELEDVIDYADQKGLRLASVGGDIDLATEQGRMLARMKGTVARYEVEQSARRLRRKHAELAAGGRHNGPRPFGWDLVKVDDGPSVLRINEAEAAVLRECVRRVLAGEGLWTIAKDLNQRGIRGSRGNQWATNVLRGVLLRWTNCGYRQHQPRKDGKPHGPPTLHRGQWDPIIDRETHERVVATLTDPSRKTNNRGTAVRYLLTSKASCGVCGGMLVGTNEFSYEIKVPPLKGSTEPRTRTRHYPHLYRCHNTACMKVSRKMAEVDDFVEQTVVGILERQGVRLLGGDPVVADEARERIKAIEAKLDLAADQFTDDQITDSQLTRITARLRPQLERERERLRNALPRGDMEEFAGPSAAEAWKAAGVEKRRALLDALAMDITIHPVGSGNGHLPAAEFITIKPRKAVRA